jgi:hypothetical protein
MLVNKNRRKIFLFAKTFSLVLGITQPPILWVLSLFPGVKWPEPEVFPLTSM